MCLLISSSFKNALQSLIIVLILVLIVSDSNASPCKAKKTLLKLRRKYFLLAKPFKVVDEENMPTPSRYNSRQKRRAFSSVDEVNRGECPWEWIQDNSVPSSSMFRVMKARTKCKTILCTLNCKAVTYRVVYLAKVNHTTANKMPVYTVRDKPVPVAFVKIPII